MPTSAWACGTPAARRRAEGDEAGHPVGMLRGHLGRPRRSAGEADEDRPVGADLVHHRHGVGGVLGVGVGGRPLRTVGPAAAAPVERDDAVPPGEVRNLRLPHPRPHDRPGRQEHDGGRPGPVDGVAEPDAVAHDVPLRHRAGPGRPAHGRTSKTLLNGVEAASRKRVKPAAVVTSRIRAGPACVPRAAPTGWDSDAGVQSRVENP